jgi:hypothetical protein
MIGACLMDGHLKHMGMKGISIKTTGEDKKVTERRRKHSRKKTYKNSMKRGDQIETTEELYMVESRTLVRKQLEDFVSQYEVNESKIIEPKLRLRGFNGITDISSAVKLSDKKRKRKEEGNQTSNFVAQPFTFSTPTNKKSKKKPPP